MPCKPGPGAAPAVPPATDQGKVKKCGNCRRLCPQRHRLFLLPAALLCRHSCHAALMAPHLPALAFKVCTTGTVQTSVSTFIPPFCKE